MLTDEKKIEISEKIVISKTFKNAPNSIALLKYLVKADIKGTFLKEGIIELDFFGSQSEKNNPRVRVNMYNLRKKLGVYYETEGKDDPYRVIIEKGQYGVKYEKQKVERKPFSKVKVSILIPYILLALVVGIFIFLSIPPKKPTIWKAFFTNHHKTTLYVGDAFGFKGKTITGRGGWIRDFTINTLEDYYKLLEKKPMLKDQTNPANYYYVTGMAVHAAKNISHLFDLYHQDYLVRNSTSASYSDIKDGNLIYVGMVKTGNKIISVFNDNNPHFQIEGNKLNVAGLPNMADTTLFIWASGVEEDMAVVSRTKGPQDTEQFYFISAHDMGVVATIEYFTNPDSLEVFTKKYLDDHASFTAIFKAHGHERTNMNLETIMVMPF